MSEGACVHGCVCVCVCVCDVGDDTSCSPTLYQPIMSPRLCRSLKLELTAPPSPVPHTPHLPLLFRQLFLYVSLTFFLLLVALPPLPFLLPIIQRHLSCCCPLRTSSKGHPVSGPFLFLSLSFSLALSLSLSFFPFLCPYLIDGGACHVCCRLSSLHSVKRWKFNRDRKTNRPARAGTPPKTRLIYLHAPGGQGVSETRVDTAPLGFDMLMRG